MHREKAHAQLSPVPRTDLFRGRLRIGVSASCAGAWMQTGASAFLPAAAAAALYGLVTCSTWLAEPAWRRRREAAFADGSARRHPEPVRRTGRGRTLDAGESKPRPAKPPAAAANAPSAATESATAMRRGRPRRKSSPSSSVADPVPASPRRLCRRALREHRRPDRAIVRAANPSSACSAPAFGRKAG